MCVNICKYNSIFFKARKVAGFELEENNNASELSAVKNIELYRLDEHDIDFLEKISRANKENSLFVSSANDLNSSKNLKSIIHESINHIIASLTMHKFFNLPYDPIHLLAIADKKPVGIITGMSPKIDRNLKITYSITNKKGEVETDWIASWSNKNGIRIKGLGKVLLSQFYYMVIKSGYKVKSFYTRSEVPEKSIALQFYKKLGLKPVKDCIRRKMDEPYDPVELNLLFINKGRKLSKLPVIPMRINRKKAEENIQKVFQKYKRQDYMEQTGFVNLNDIASI